jgi:hypothetical protein
MSIDEVATTNLLEVLDRVLDKGVVLDAWIRVSVIGIDLLTIEAHVVVASIQTHLQYANEVMGIASTLASPRRLHS